MAGSHRPSKRFLGIFVSIALVASVAGSGLASAAPRRAAAPPSGVSAAGSASALFDLAGERLDATLRDKVAKAKSSKDRDARVDVAVLVAKGVKPPRELEMPLKIALRADPKHDLYAGRAKVRSLVKVATAKGVAKVFDNGRKTPPPIPDKMLPSKAQRAAAAKAAKARLAAAAKAGALKEFRSLFDSDGVQVRPARTVLSAKDAVLRGADASYDGGGATGWFDVSPRGHNSAAAWDAGYTGAGVKVAVADDSVDFAHPDLQGTYAVVDDPASPYYGWPEAFDPFSALLYAYDVYYHTSFVADGQTWWSDTSATITEAEPVFDGKEIVTPGTSKSGVYHIGYLWDENLYAWMSGWSEYPLVLVSDETTPGVYDTVYVDVWMDYDFSYEKPCTIASPTSYLDYWDSQADDYGPDGYADLSGGTVYWIADGEHQPPGFEFLIGGHDPSAPVPGNGELVCFMGALNFDENHGTLCASNVVGQGVTDGPSDAIMDGGVYPPFKTPTGGGDGMVQGAARDSKVVAFADIYWNFFTSTLLSYDYAAFGADMEAGTGDEIPIVSNSYGESAEDADEWDYPSRYITALNTYVNPNVAFLFSTGNGAPGYGTNAPPTPSTGIGIGASTQMGACGGWDSIYDADQVTIGDVIPWSNRGPSAMGHTGPAVVADGAYSSGAMALNQGAWDGWRSWVVWGGTSRSCPVAAGNLALIYDAFKQRHGRFPTYEEARGLLMAGARDLGYDPAVQGAGMVDAKKSIDIITGEGGCQVMPSQWYPGDYRGSAYPSFPSVVYPGRTYDGTLTLTNTTRSDEDVEVTVSDKTLELLLATTMIVHLDGAQESPYDFNRPDWLYDLRGLVNTYDPDLMVVRLAVPFSDFAPTGAFNTSGTTHNTTRLLAYDWKDQDEDGVLWNDADRDGYVDPGEMDPGEYMRFTYANNFGNSQEIRVQNPTERMHDGIFLGVQHRFDAQADKTVQVRLVVELYKEADHPWLSSDMEGAPFDVPAGSIELPVRLTVPADAKPGFYEGAFVISSNRGGAPIDTVVPVLITVASDTPSFSFGDISGIGPTALHPARSGLDPADPSPLYSNRQMSGYQDWNWRAESGDWRFFMADVSDEHPLPAGATWLVKTSWPDRDQPVETDIDTLLYGPADDGWSSMDASVFGPHGMELKGGSANNNVGAGIWLWQTNTGTTEEWVAGPLERGLNQIMLHSVVWSGETWREPVSGEAGVVGIDPAALDICDSASSGTAPLNFVTTMALNGLAVEPYGLSRRVQVEAEISQGEDWYYDFDLASAAYLDVAVSAAGGSDIDLYLYRWTGSVWQLVGASETASGNEHVRVEAPADGYYVVDVYGYSVSGTDTFTMTLSAPAGDDLAVTGVPAGPLVEGQNVPLSVQWTKDRTDLAEREGVFEGVVYVGPVEAPHAIAVPVTLRYPFEVERYTPNPSEPATTPTPAIKIQFSKRLDQDSIGEKTFTLSDGTETIPLDVAVDADAGSVVLTPLDTLRSSAEYFVEIDELLARDGDELTTTLPFSTSESLVRAMGATRYETAVAVSTQTFAEASAVVLVTGENFPDALSASALAGAVKGPVLLTKPTVLLTQVRDEIVRLGATKVYLVGGAGALSDEVKNAVDSIPGVEVERVAGADRYQTAAAVARKVEALTGGPVKSVFLVRGDDFADGVAASPYAYKMCFPVLLTQRDTLPAATEAAIQDLALDSVQVVGGTGAVSNAVVNQLPSGLAVARHAGKNRYATAVALAEAAAAHDWGAWNRVVGLATGRNFPDALTGGVAIGVHDGVMLLTEPAVLSPETKAAIEAHAAEIVRLQVIGGPGAVSAAVSNAVANLLW